MFLAKTIIEIPELDRGDERAELVLETHKSAVGGIASTARVQFVSPGKVSFDLKRDFNHRITYDPFALPTQNSITAQHDKVFTPVRIELLTDQARLSYLGAGATVKQLTKHG